METELSKPASRCPTDNLMETLFLFIQTVVMVSILYDVQEGHKIKSDVLDYTVAHSLLTLDINRLLINQTQTLFQKIKVCAVH